MNRKTKYALLFPGIALRNFSALLKNLLNFAEVSFAKQKVAEMGFGEGLPTIAINQISENLQEEIKRFTFLDGTSRVIDIALLKVLAKKFTDCDYLEIGSWRGESILNVAPLCKECYSVSLSKEEMKDLNFSNEAIALDAFLIKDIPNLKRIAHNSLTFDFSTLNKKFDLIFVDGDHTYEGVMSDTQNVFKLLKNENSIIVWHDCGYFYEDQRWDVIAGILGGATEAQRKNIYRVSNSMCGIYMQGNYKTQQRIMPHKPEHIYDVAIRQGSL